MATEDVFEQEMIGVGDDVFTAGLFTRHVGKTLNAPIVRAANDGKTAISIGRPPSATVPRIGFTFAVEDPNGYSDGRNRRSSGECRVYQSTLKHLAQSTLPVPLSNLPLT